MNNSATDPTAAAPVGGIGRSVALVGSDGAGKSTVAQEVVRRLPFDAEYLYMGVNLEASPVMLPTTRLALAVKRRRGGGTDMTVGGAEHGHRGGPLGTVRRLVRMTNWIAEETFRAVLARRIQRRPAVVVFDRHFFCDYYAGAIAPTSAPRSLDTRIHGFVLRHWYPRPELTLFLDAPPEVLVARKAGDTIERVARRRRDYLALESVMPAFDVVDADRPIDEVVEDVVARIVAFVEGSAASAGVPMAAERSPDETAATPAAIAPEPVDGLADDTVGHGSDVIEAKDGQEILVASDITGTLKMDTTTATGS